MKTIFRPIIICLLLLLLWQGIVDYWHWPDYLLPSPWQTFATLYDQRILILTQSLPTMIEIGVGFTCGILFGCLAACLMIFFRSLSHWLLPIIITSQVIPIFAIAPLFVVWLGYGSASKIAVTILMIFFPVTSALYDGLSRTPPLWFDLATTMNASRWRLFYYIRLPAALPTLASGIRIAAVSAPLGAIVSEWVGSSLG